MSSYRAGAGRYFSARRDRIAAFHLDAVESIAGQACLCVAGVDPCLAGLVVKQEVGPPVAVHILDVARAMRLGAVALRWVVGETSSIESNYPFVPSQSNTPWAAGYAGGKQPQPRCKVIVPIWRSGLSP